jgi:twitching motility protein PilT
MAGDEHREYLTGLAGPLVEMGGSDLHLKVPAPPAVRARGQLDYLEGHPPLGPEDTAAIPGSTIPDAVAGEFESDGEADFSLSLPGIGRFRVNAFTQRGSASIVMR